MGRSLLVRFASPAADRDGDANELPPPDWTQPAQDAAPPADPPDCDPPQASALRGRFLDLGVGAGDSQAARGWPLSTQSWANRPFHADAFVGGLFADNPLPGRVHAGTGFLWGARLGWDWHPNLGFETRFARATVPLDDPDSDNLLGDERIYLWDVDLLYYPWGEAVWRPYFLLGVGFADVNFVNDLDQKLHETLFAMPLGVGMKYRWDSRLTFRADLADNLAFGGGSRLGTLSNLSLTAGLEYRFGGPRRSYYPWNPSRSWW